MVIAVFGGLNPIATFGETQSRTSTPPPDPSPTPSSRKNLSEYARGRDLQSASSGQKKSLLITNENLEGLASGVELTSVAVPTDPKPGAKASPETPRDYWRGRVKAQQDKIRTLEDDNNLKDQEISRLWTLFYSCNEPEVRENDIRIRLKQKLIDRTRLRSELKTAHLDFKELLVEARRNGVLPGWFRDLVK